MRVLYIASGDYKYGASKSMMSLILSLKENYNVEPILLTKKRNKLNEICDELGIENHSMWYCDFMSGSPYTFIPMILLKHCVKFGLFCVGTIRQHSILKCGIDFSTIDIIHTNLNRITIGAYISNKLGIPHIWHIREFGKEDYNVRFYRPNTIGFMNQSANKFIAISNAVRDYWINLGIDENKIVTVYNGIGDKDFVEKKNREDDILKLVIIGHIQPGKGQLQLVEAVSLLPKEVQDKIQVDIIGEGYSDYLREINETIKKHNLNNIHFLGYCDHIPQKLSEYDVGVMCSKSEGFGRVTVEYLLAGLFVIASDTGANPEIIESAHSGILYEYGNSNSLAECILSIYNQKAAGKLQTGSFENNFTLKQCAEKVYEIYNGVLNGGFDGC